MNTRTLLAWLTLTLIMAPVSAQDLLVVQHGVDEVTLIDRASIAHSESNARAWVVRNFDARQPATETRPAHRSIRIRMAFDCPQRRIAVAERVYHESAFGRGRVVARQRSDDPLVFAQPASGLDRTLLAMVCER
jgi:hypothetical protein